MNRFVFIAAVAATSAFAQVRVEVQIPVPTITFQAPPALVVIEPGVQVVEDYDDEVFFVDNLYWCRRGDRWYRSHDHRGNWVVVEHTAVPVSIVRYAPGQYRHWRREAVRHEVRQEIRREERHEEKHEKHEKKHH